MSNIPQAMKLLRNVARDLELSGLRAKARRLRYIVTRYLPRVKARHMVHGTRAKCTPALRAKIVAWFKSHPHWTQQRIAEKFNVTNARVSYTLRGFAK